MATQNNDGSVLDPNPVVAEILEPKLEKIDTLDAEIPIEKIVEKITLAGDLNPVVADTLEVKLEKIDNLDAEIPIEKIVENITLAGDPNLAVAGTLEPKLEKIDNWDAEIPIENIVEKITLAGDPNAAVAETLELKLEKIDTLDAEIPIENIAEKITLAGDPLSVDVNENDNKDNNDDEDDSESESDSESSESESSSSASSSSSSSDSDSDEDGEIKDSDDEDGEIKDSDDEEMVSWSEAEADFDVDDEDEVVVGPIWSTNEIQNLPPVPTVDVTLEPHHKMQPVGVVMSTLGPKVVVEGVEKHEPLNEGSILWLTESRKPLGLVDEIFGPVKNPYYVVRYNSENDIPAGIQGGTTLVSCVPEFADRVLNHKDLYRKGYDASGPNDEELSDEVEFSDDEKEAEYRKMRKMTKRGNSDQNPGKNGKKRNNKSKFSLKEMVLPTPPKTSAAAQRVLHTAPNAPAVAPLVNHGNHSSFLGTGQGGTTAVSPFQPLNAGPNFAANAMWPNQTTFLQQSQLSLLPNAFPTNVGSYYPQNTQFSHQFPVPGGPFQQQLNPSYGTHFPTMMPGLQPNIYPQQPNIYPQQPVHAPGFVGQNQMPFGLSSPFQPNQPSPIFQAQQGSFQQNQPPPGFSPTELQPSPSSISGNPSPFHPGSSASQGRPTFRAAGRKGWRPAR
ncbi:H/ACA ribonucleoprotein complex non-core subunit NAF1-like [Vicia villosa]|uniref:H/ACA ribonucleoprotein complex non-core subunit NAF1-like n=1 Tax=Vicia villosa TaxID=3911 RepID=UPI00273C727C|nr:H/ACA ribonucleoprotein complex non-core subunit NAF1-like [Vicia villosa]